MSASDAKDDPTAAGNAARVRWWNFGSNFAWTASLFLAGLGAKLGLICKFGQSFPYLDQWPGEAMELFEPYFSGKSVLLSLIKPHNEHFIFFTRVFDLALLLLNGQWDGLLETAFNAVLHCAGIAGFGWALASLLGKKSWPLLWLVLFLDLALPFAWENTLWGFQSQFYFLIIFSWLTLWLLGLNDAFSARWWLGAFCGLAALFTVASGFLAAAAVMAVTGLAAWKQKAGWRRHLPTWGVCVIIIAFGLGLKMSQPTDHTTEAKSLVDFAQALGKGLAWPWALSPWYSAPQLSANAAIGLEMRAFPKGIKTRGIDDLRHRHLGDVAGAGGRVRARHRRCRTGLAVHGFAQFHRHRQQPGRLRANH